MTHPALVPGAVAVITGGASGIGLAAAKRFAAMGMRVCIADIGSERMHKALREISEVKGADATQVAGLETDVSSPEDVARLHQFVRNRWSRVDVLMNNAGIQPGSSIFDLQGTWDRVLAVNLGGAVLGTREFVPGMLAAGKPGLVINTGSKQGITTPPGDPAYNVSKAGLKVFTEALQHELRNTPGCQVTAHLLIPGFVFTELTAQGRTEKPPAAWTPEQTVDFMVEGLHAGDFYILCPDNDVPRALDERRILWAAADLVENRPPLSRWHPQYAAAFVQFAQLAPGAPISKP
jgi:NAD(P)-dependent dehydrogenase (short-subunit alcohol dehydrogenase family)